MDTKDWDWTMNLKKTLPSQVKRYIQGENIVNKVEQQVMATRDTGKRQMKKSGGQRTLNEM